MIRIRYIGTGEAFDEELPNTSLVFDGARRVLLDCGYSVPQVLWRAHSADPDWLDAVYISHFHADHCFGLPALCIRMAEDGRTRDLPIFGGPGSAAATEHLLDTGYTGLPGKLPFAVRCIEVQPESDLGFGPLVLRVAASRHPVPCWAVRISQGTTAVCYSGDGGPTAETEGLYRGAALLVHEAYFPEPSSKRSHASVPEVLQMAAGLGVGTLHLVHQRRGAAREDRSLWPRPGDVFTL